MNPPEGDSGKPRRGRGEGSLTELPNGRYMARVTVAPGRRRAVYGDTKAEVRVKMRDALARAEKGEPMTDARETLGTFITEWLEGPAKARVRPSTFLSYASYVRRHIVPGLGRHRLARLRPEDVDRFLVEKREEGLSPRSCQYMRAILRAALAWAEKRGRVARNVAALSEPVRVERHEIRPLTIEEAQRAVFAAEGDRLGALWVMAIDTGLRQGELAGLRWIDVDLDTRAVRVVQAREHVPGPPRFGPPKSSSSRRGLTMTATTVHFLREHRARQLRERLAAGTRWQDSGLVFTSPTGAPLDGPTMTHRWQAFLAANGLPRQRFHDARHASASFLLAQGVPIKAIAERLGHSQITLTLSTYAHLAAELQGHAADLMDLALTGRKQGTA